MVLQFPSRGYGAQPHGYPPPLTLVAPEAGLNQGRKTKKSGGAFGRRSTACWKLFLATALPEALLRQ